jgi:hypothetical protein
MRDLDRLKANGTRKGRTSASSTPSDVSLAPIGVAVAVLLAGVIVSLVTGTQFQWGPVLVGPERHRFPFRGIRPVRPGGRLIAGAHRWMASAVSVISVSRTEINGVYSPPKREPQKWVQRDSLRRDRPYAGADPRPSRIK